jgi:2-polyprenyl-3-methyl-5-hydroxy-6-metoxy-1,4-benzoquinol methylase
MSEDASKTESGRMKDRFPHTIFQGRGIEIGGGRIPVTPDCVRWDQEQGDVQLLTGISSESFDWVYSSHCLEHLVSPGTAIQRWWDVLKSGGTMRVVVPNEDLYEQSQHPHLYGNDPGSTFTIHKSSRWREASVNLIDLFTELPNHKILSVHTCDFGDDYPVRTPDQNASGAAAHIEILVQKTASSATIASREVTLAQTLWEWWGRRDHPAEWDGRKLGGGKGSQRFWEYLWTVQNLPPSRRVLDVGGGDNLFLADLLSTKIPEIWCLDPEIPLAKRSGRYLPLTLQQFLSSEAGHTELFDSVTCVSVLEHVGDKADFCRQLDTIRAPIVLTFELAYKEDLVTMPMVYDVFAQMQHHYVARMEVCPVWADNSNFGQWRPLGVVLEQKR